MSWEQLRSIAREAADGVRPGRLPLMGDVVALPAARRWQLSPSLRVELRPVEDHHSAAIVLGRSHGGWVDVWAVGAELVHETRFRNVAQAPAWPNNQVCEIVDEWVARIVGEARMQ